MAGALAFAGCTMGSLAGAGSETTNSLTGTVVGTEGPASGVAVRLLPRDYDCVKGTPHSQLPLVTTDAHGIYRFRGIDSGAYSVEAVGLSKGGRAILFGLHVTANDTAPADTLHAAGVIKVPLAAGFDSVNGYVFIPGTLVFGLPAPGSDTIVLDSVASGTIPAVAYASRTDSRPPQDIGDSVSVMSNAATILSYQGFAYAKKLFFNTAASGANVSGDVLDFPVLIRLNSSNFNFAQAQNGGADVRFSKSNGVPLSFEVEQWDSASAQGAVWVKVDTVYGSNASQFIQMYWGKASAAAASSSSSVFDTLDGYRGVWHQGLGLSDATAYRDNGVDSSTTDTAGIIGRCRRFDPANRSFITIPNETRFDMTTNITLSAWFMVDAISVNWQTILAKGDSDYRLHCDSADGLVCFSVTTADTADYGYKDLAGTTHITDHAWHFVCGVFDGTTMQTYVDGALQGTKVISMPTVTDNWNLTIGNNQPRSPRFFAGAIDEVRVMNTVAGANWVKLCYMNQKAQDALVVFK